MADPKPAPAAAPLTIAERKERLLAVRSNDFMELVQASGFDPAVHFRFMDLRGADLRGLNLRGFDFTGALLHGARFDRAQIAAGPDRNGKPAAAACFDQVEIGEVRLDLNDDPHKPAKVTRIANLREAEDWKAYADIKTWKRGEGSLAREYFQPGAIFVDAPFAPQLVVVPPGTFERGTSPEEIAALAKEHGDDFGSWVRREAPQLDVTIAAPFAVGRFPVTFEEWDAAQRHPDWKKFSGIERRLPNDRKWGRDERPVIDVSWNDAQAYVWWLTAVTGRTYRLLSEAEWEYCCRAGTETHYCFGDDPAGLANIAWFDENSDDKTHPVGRKNANAFGLHDMHGNVWEWCEDEWHDNYDGAPTDRSARQGKRKVGDRVVRGGSWNAYPQGLRSAFRGLSTSGSRGYDRGFRVARTL